MWTFKYELRGLFYLNCKILNQRLPPIQSDLTFQPTKQAKIFNSDGTALYIILTFIRTIFLALTQIMVRCKFAKETKSGNLDEININ